MYVAMLCTKDVVTVGYDASLMTAAQLMQAHRTDCLAVVRGDGGTRVIDGLVTDHDLAIHGVGKGLDAAGTMVGDLERSPAVRVSTGASIDDAIARMLLEGVRRLMVVGPDGRLAGLLEFDEVLLALAGQLAGLAQSLPAGRLPLETLPATLAPHRQGRGLPVGTEPAPESVDTSAPDLASGAEDDAALAADPLVRLRALARSSSQAAESIVSSLGSPTMRG